MRNINTYTKKMIIITIVIASFSFLFLNATPVAAQNNMNGSCGLWWWDEGCSYYYPNYYGSNTTFQGTSGVNTLPNNGVGGSNGVYQGTIGTNTTLNNRLGGQNTTW
jgi:hypothetical protein